MIKNYFTMSDEKQFKEIRLLLKEVDDRRGEENLDDKEREALELSARALRDAERALIHKEQKEIARSLGTMEKELKALSKEIRERVTTMNQLPKFLDATEKVIQEIIKILKVVGKF